MEPLVNILELHTQMKFLDITTTETVWNSLGLSDYFSRGPREFRSPHESRTECPSSLKKLPIYASSLKIKMEKNSTLLSATLQHNMNVTRGAKLIPR